MSTDAARHTAAVTRWLVRVGLYGVWWSVSTYDITPVRPLRHPWRGHSCHDMTEKSMRRQTVTLRPPSTRMIWPVTNGASRSNHNTALATSSGVPLRWSGVRASMVSCSA